MAPAPASSPSPACPDLHMLLGKKGKIAALFSLSIAIGNTFGPVASGYAGELLGLQAAFLVPVGLMLVALVWFAWYLTRLRSSLAGRIRQEAEC